MVRLVKYEKGNLIHLEEAVSEGVEDELSRDDEAAIMRRTLSAQLLREVDLPHS